jgi:hypothetical protein
MLRSTRLRWVAVQILVAGSAFTALSVAAGPAVGTTGVTRTIAASGIASMPTLASGTDAIQFPEFAGSPEGGEEQAVAAQAVTNRSLSPSAPGGVAAPASKKAKSNPQLGVHFNGLNHRDQRLANGGNQFSLEPPDQGLCVGGNFVLETVNDVLRVYNKSGTPLTGVVDQNTFYGYPPAINRTTGIFGPFVTDPSCYFDPNTQRWFHVVLTLDVNPVTGAFLGPNHLDLAVSNSANPTGSWTIYRLPVQDDGTQGTPNHGCAGGPCLGDFPHIGADANGIYLTTNEYPFFANGFHGAQIYAFSKQQLASTPATVSVTQFDTAAGLGHDLAGTPGFTVWPAISPGGNYDTAAAGTEYFLSSMAAEEANGTGSDHRVGLWALSNTSSLNGTPALALNNTVIDVLPYVQPPKANQKPGDIPLGECLNIPACATFLNGVPDPFAPEVESHLDSSDTRMMQVTYANGKVWGALGTGLTMNGDTRAGIVYYIIKPVAGLGAVTGSVAKQGYVGLAGNNLTYPTVAALNSGRGTLSFTVTGDDFYPSVGYAALDPNAGAGEIHIAQPGVGPHDGFTAYKFYVGDPPRTRWGDYGAAVADGHDIWIAAEYIAQTCTLTQYLTAPVGSCSGTRTALGNWGTHIARLTP